jgi:hypothetical protein
VITDLPSGPTDLDEFNSYNWSTADAAACYASITYVARVRTKAGRILVADPRPVLEQAAWYDTAAKLMPADLEAAPRPTTGP